MGERQQSSRTSEQLGKGRVQQAGLRLGLVILWEYYLKNIRYTFGKLEDKCLHNQWHHTLFNNLFLFLKNYTQGNQNKEF